MFQSNDQFYEDFFKSIDNLDDMISLDLSDNTLDKFIESYNINDEIQDPLNCKLPFNTHTQNKSEIPSQSTFNLDNQVVSQTTHSISTNSQSNTQQLQIIEQPYQRSKLRYRTDYNREKGRLGALGSKNGKKLSAKAPAIRIPQCYFNLQEEYYIRISLVTVKHKKTNIHYFHPYELEDPKYEKFNDRQNNTIWYPIEYEDSTTGIKRFPFLRIVKKKGFQLKETADLCKFDCDDQSLPDNITLSHHSSPSDIDIIDRYNLERSQLAFTIGKKIMINDQSSMILFAHTTIFSDEMNEHDEKHTDTETENESSSENSDQSPSRLHIYKYAPRHGFAQSNDDMLIFLTKKISSKAYKHLQVTFEYDGSKQHWSQSVNDLEIKGRMISFKIPNFPYLIRRATPVDILLCQNDHILSKLKYTYLPNCE